MSGCSPRRMLSKAIKRLARKLQINTYSMVASTAILCILYCAFLLAHNSTKTCRWSRFHRSSLRTFSVCPCPCGLLCCLFRWNWLRSSESAGYGGEHEECALELHVSEQYRTWDSKTVRLTVEVATGSVIKQWRRPLFIYISCLSTRVKPCVDWAMWLSTK